MSTDANVSYVLEAFVSKAWALTGPHFDLLDLFWIYYFQVIVQEEYQIYPFESFVADVGGYLGLLLGASILSLVESSTNIITRFLLRRPK